MRIIKAIYLVVGTLSLGLGLIGIVVPILPTTPFLLLTLYCYAKGSEKFHQWFIHTKIYEKHLKNFAESRSLTLKTKISLVTFASSMLIVAFFATNKVFVKGMMVFLFLFLHYYFIFQIKTVEKKLSSLVSP